MKILVTGHNGLVGSRFKETSRYADQIVGISSQAADLTTESSVSKIESLGEFDWIIHFAAFTDVGAAEQQRGDKYGRCYLTNVVGTEKIVQIAQRQKARICFVSTDMVFDGKGGPYDENQIPEANPNTLSWYGYTKAEAEKLCRAYSILRITYPVRSNFFPKPDYVRKPLKLFRDKGKLYPMFTDQQVSITFIDEACRAIDKIIAQDATGIFHAGSIDTTTPFEFYGYLFKQMHGHSDMVVPGALEQFLKTVENPLRYPRLAGLKVEKTQNDLSVVFSDWKGIVDKLIAQGIAI